jgi:hypothetical protein
MMILLSRNYSIGLHMELKTARLTILLDPAKKQALEQLCLQQDVTPSQVVRRLIREYLETHGVEWQPGGLQGPAAGNKAR